jgi:hypothetical protein
MVRPIPTATVSAARTYHVARTESGLAANHFRSVTSAISLPGIAAVRSPLAAAVIRTGVPVANRPSTVARSYGRRSPSASRSRVSSQSLPPGSFTDAAGSAGTSAIRR